MENLIEGRVILGFLCLIHLFLNYAGASNAVHDLVNKKVLNFLILTELVAVTAFVIYDNIQTPPYDGWFAAILGYLFVYFMIGSTWLLFYLCTFLEKDKVYEMTIETKVLLRNKQYFGGTVISNGEEVEVLLPYKEEYLALEKPRKVNVKFNILMRGYYIVEPVE